MIAKIDFNAPASDNTDITSEERKQPEQNVSMTSAELQNARKFFQNMHEKVRCVIELKQSINQSIMI